ncbi:uncharacterized protein MKK02DRAFT_37617 [Dioszegia hungarica]|uniref:Uncharacterized protein n=1 Tax=Dioszegia hungarica TaxID=4972 RepID=A0AA38LTL0_9TREE|nr:uncharacterized protein MKK02DRAFT_37617 [Dioszegia hungarica]KAI9634738.1 hypothetical protein MKK02DRAFT_37617 [Dioszegia hungarica]
MESLSPECTPLKHRYDSCFNSWFEGYLQPALDADPSRFTHLNDTPYTPPSQPVAGPSKPLEQRRIVTNWSAAFPARTAAPQPIAPETQPSAPDDPVEAVRHTPYIADTKGKSRNQIKAEEYEQRCGSAWRSYQSCLKASLT